MYLYKRIALHSDDDDRVLKKRRKIEQNTIETLPNTIETLPIDSDVEDTEPEIGAGQSEEIQLIRENSINAATSLGILKPKESKPKNFNLVLTSIKNMNAAISYNQRTTAQKRTSSQKNQLELDEKEYHEYINTKLMAPFCTAEYENKRCRSTMEDSISSDSFTLNKRFFQINLVCDGHGHPTAYQTDTEGRTRGQICSKQASTLIPRNLKVLLSANKITTEEALFKAISKIDDTLCKRSYTVFGGTTAVVSVLEKTEKGMRLVVGNVGDSRVIGIYKDAKTKQPCSHGFTVDHSAKSISEAKPNEHNRIEQSGGSIKRGRVYSSHNGKPHGGLAMTRSLGDKHYVDEIKAPSGTHKRLISGIPDIMTLEPEDFLKYEGLFLACDGIWDVLSAQRVATIMLSGKNPSSQVKAVIKEAIQCGSTDNISAIFIDVRNRQ